MRWVLCGGGGLWAGFLGVCIGRGDVRMGWSGVEIGLVWSSSLSCGTSFSYAWLLFSTCRHPNILQFEAMTSVRVRDIKIVRVWSLAPSLP